MKDESEEAKACVLVAVGRGIGHVVIDSSSGVSTTGTAGAIFSAEIFLNWYGWGSKFGTTKCRTADISKIRNFEY